MDYKIINDNTHEQFYIQLNEKEAYLKYKMKDEKTIELIDTFVPEEHRGIPYAKELVRYALNFARENKLKVIPTCPYVNKFITKTRDDYRDLLIEE